MYFLFCDWGTILEFSCESQRLRGPLEPLPWQPQRRTVLTNSWWELCPVCFLVSSSSTLSNSLLLYRNQCIDLYFQWMQKGNRKGFMKRCHFSSRSAVLTTLRFFFLFHKKTLVLSTGKGATTPDRNNQSQRINSAISVEREDICIYFS